MSDYVSQHSYDCSFDNSDSWTVLSPIERSIKEKIERVGKPLKDWDINIYRGVLTGCNEAFIISGAKKDELIAADPKSAEIIRPILRGKDINRYGYNFADLWLIYIPWHFPLHLDTSITGSSVYAEKMFKKEYPAVYNHLLGFKTSLSARNSAETGIRYEWYALQRWGANYWKDFSKQKIVYREIGLAMDACLVSHKYFINNKLYMITGEKLEYLLAFFNSKLFNILFESTNVTGGKGTDFLSKVNIIVPTVVQENAIKRLLTPRVLEDKINQFFYNIYGLTDDETYTLENRKPIPCDYSDSMNSISSLDK